MLENEAKWIAEQLRALDNNSISPVVEIGSSTEHFRKFLQPHIDREVWSPLRNRGVETIHVDVKEDHGVDICGDITCREVQIAILSRSPKLVICANMLEHVTDRAAVVRFLSDIVCAGGYLLLTAPQSYPFHPDPIDNGFRPTPGDLSALFSEYSTLSQAIVRGETYAERIVNRPRMFLSIPIRILFAPNGYAAWRAEVASFGWLFRPFSVSAVLLKRNQR